MLDDTFAFQTGQTISRMIYFAASYCVPMFFMVSGFTFGRTSFSAEYVEKKILGIMKKLFAWIIFWCVVYAFIYGEEHNPFIELIDGSFSGGLLPVSWFIFTLCLCWLVGYGIFALHEKERKVFYILILLLTTLMLIKRSIALPSYIPFYDTGTQATWFGLYLTFFMIGMLLRDMLGVIVREKAYYKVFITLALIILTIVYVKTSSLSGRSPADFYGSWIYMLWFMLIFLVALNLCPYSRQLHVIAKGTFSVYMWHLPVLLFITRYIPVKGARVGIFMIIGLFVSGELIYMLFRKYPLLKKMV